MAKKRTVGKITWAPRKHHLKENGANSGFGSPSVYHALIIIFLEFFAWGLLTSPIIMVLNQTFPNHTFLLNGLIQGVRWYFTMLSLSGLFSVTFSVVFAYVADITSDEERGQAYGLVSATFAASLVTNPALGAYLENAYSDNLVVWLATAVAVLDVLFILLFVPESLPEKIRPVSYGSQISWEQADPFGALKRIGADKLILLLCCTVFLSYLPEAGEYSSFFVYLRLVMNFSAEEVASYIALVGVLSVIAQTLILTFLMRYLGHKASIMFGLVFEISQLICYGFGSQTWIIWMAGCIAAMSSVTYPAISAFASEHAAPDQQGAAQGLITGIRGLCNGLGPAVNGTKSANTSHVHDAFREMVPGPPFAFGAILVIMAFLVAIFIPEDPHSSSIAGRKKSAKLNESFNNGSGDVKIEAEPLLLNDNNL
ncbi:Hippocampus abundant transcript 1 protein,Hippocampus abundant transcript-like protein 1 [Mytilus edulis]|uniref:Hippocampus abundant transcript 1 protein,Hippocampus abundant transcript-like protein 1 n=1 Tax=Mytilus edulis TaxID=6550 RepID=A0A8S3SVF9_MYTED|nr:Hippocampus abundant transcript 1 protein,Hippocampus abundant transcript-like protein 1 [Mytilus edulis]